MKSTIGTIAVIIVLAGCITPELPPAPIPFTEAEFKAYEGRGTARIIGQAFLKTRGGDVKTGAGNFVMLLPSTPYTLELRRRMQHGEKLPALAGTPLAKYMRTTTADAGGNFEFSELPAGQYYMNCIITWEVPSQYGPESTGGVAYGDATVSEGQTVKVIVTR